MTEHNGFTWTPGDELQGPASTGLLTPKASALAGFTLSVLSMLGQGSWTSAVQSFLGTNFAPREFSTVVLVGGLASLALACGGAYLGRRAMARRRVDAWEDSVGRAAVLVGGVGAVLAVVTIIGGFVSGLS